VIWTNQGGQHNVASDQPGLFRSGNPAFAPWTFIHTFTSAGEFRYHCEVHGGVGFGMSGIVRVQDGGGGGAPGSLRFPTGSFVIGEGGTATITVQRTGGDDGAVGVSYTTADGTATTPGDYAPRSGTLSWVDGQDGNRSFTVPTVQDAAAEANETVQITLSSPTGGATLGSPSGAVLTILDDDDTAAPGTLGFAAPTASAVEGAGAATLQVERTGGSDGAVSAQVTTADGTATAGSDYVAAQEVVSFGPGDVAAQNVHVSLVDDGVPEPAESFHAMLGTPTGGASLGTAAATVTVIDDDVTAGPCVPDEHTLCFHEERFSVTATFRAPGGEVRQATRIPLTDASGLFYFFNANNVEMLVKVIRACVPQFDRYWVFVAATTNVEYTLTVIDTQADLIRVYTNDQGQAAIPVQDTAAFDTCP
jgi:hypothetical protein